MRHRRHQVSDSPQVWKLLPCSDICSGIADPPLIGATREEGLGIAQTSSLIPPPVTRSTGRPGAGARQEIIPGSSLHGAVRSLHETLTGSCLRVFNPLFVPVYRDTASNTASMRLAVVRRVGPEGRPTEFQLCESGDPIAHRIHQDVLDRHHGLDSGTEVHVVQDAEGKVIDAQPQPGGGWIVFISDAGARVATKPYHAAVRKLTSATVAGPDRDGVVWNEFLRSVEDADDRRPAKQGVGLVEVTFRYKPKSDVARDIVVGRRYRASPSLAVGQPVWVRLDGQERITRLQLAQIWRHTGQYPAEKRLPSPGKHGGLGACSNSQWLCPSCRLFGSADTKEGGAPRPGYADQQSYRGHVRFSDAVPTGPVEPLKITLPPMGSPHPGSGQFYLVSDSQLVGNGTRDTPLRAWGASPEQPQRPRRLRGRKFYWHTPGDHQERGNARARQIEKHPDQVQPAVAFPAGTRFTATLTLIDVDEVQLGSLLATLQPGNVLGRDDLVVHLGGGKPLGYGSCTITVETGEQERASRLWRSSSRYRQHGPGDTLDLTADRDRLLQAFCLSEDRADGETWRALGIALRRDAVAADRVWYPPGRTWDDRARLAEEFDAGFEFWKQTSGLRLADDDHGQRQGYPLATLPTITDADQSMPIVPGEAQKEPLHGREL
jgi:hypothetical protein